MLFIIPSFASVGSNKEISLQEITGQENQLSLPATNDDHKSAITDMWRETTLSQVVVLHTVATDKF